MQREHVSEELKPCPFCGYAITVEEGVCEKFGDDEEDLNVFTGICCPGCACFVQKPSEFASVEEGIQAWNTRAESDLTTLRASLAEREEEARRLREALEKLEKAASEFHDNATEYLSDSTYDADGNLANSEAELSVVAIPAARSALSPTPDHTRVQGGVEKGWQPIETCPIRDTVDLWCVYGGEEYAQFEGGASIGMLVSGRFRTEEYGFFGNQSNDGVPRKNAPDLVPVAWRDAVPQCPAELIAKALGIPLTLEAALAASSKEVSHD